jgi:hypothetical protein
MGEYGFSMDYVEWVNAYKLLFAGESCFDE